ncbi:hypothetical protein Tco_0909062 [Tanacetum coccineum]|uniref:Uncharacterized protein n=1 Tax=Tanacetum coccineum TaxID=301880 RepID=A0ABQ5CRQ0_9ASTR
MFPITKTHETSSLKLHQNHDTSAKPKVARYESAICHHAGHVLRLRSQTINHQNRGVGLVEISVVEGAQVTEVESNKVRSAVDEDRLSALPDELIHPF